MDISTRLRAPHDAFFVNGLQGRFKSATGYGVLPKLVPPARVL